MIEKVKKGTRNYCVTALVLLLLTGITEPQQIIDNNTPLHAQGETAPYDEEDYEDDLSPEENEEEGEVEENDAVQEEQAPLNISRRINAILVHGNKATSKAAILNHIPYKIGETFDARKTRLLIHNLYYNLKKFRTIKVMGEAVDNNSMKLHVFVEEKSPLKEIKTSGNKKVSDKEIAKKINVDAITTIDEEELKIIANKIKEIYLEKGYCQTEIATELAIDEGNRATALFTVDEGIA